MQAFFDYARTLLFAGSLSQSQVDGINILLSAWTAHGDGDKRKLAYILATAKHETASTMQPLAEYGHGAGHDYGIIDATGKAPYGRGFVQLTFAANYRNADAKLGLNGALAKDYDLALKPDIAAEIIIYGMLDGWFTGKKLSDYIGAICDFIGARRIVNGTDRATLIAGYATEFLNGLNKVDAPYAPNNAPPTPFPPLPRPTPMPAPKPAPTGFWQALLALLVSLFNRRI